MKAIHRFILYEDGEEYKLYNGKRLVVITKAKAEEILKLLSDTINFIPNDS